MGINKMISRYCVLCTMIFSLSCSNGGDSEKFFDIPSYTIKSVGEIYPADTFFTVPSYVVLETLKESMIAEISRIYIVKDRIYIQDKKSQKVLIFTMDGKFVRAIRNVGVGPGEYVQLTDISVNCAGQLVLYADIPSKLIICDTTGTCIKEKKLDKTFLHMTCSNDLIYFMHIPDSKYTLSIYDIAQDKMQDVYRALPSYNDVYIKGNLISGGRKVLFFRRFDNVLYSAQDNNLVPFIWIDFGNNGFIDKRTLKQNMAPHDFFMLCKKNNCVFTMVNAQVLSDNVLFNSNLPYLYIVSLSSGKSYTISRLIDSVLGLSIDAYQRIMIEGDSGYVGFLFDAGALKAQVHYLKDQHRKINSDFEKTIGMLEDDSNPVLVLYKLRPEIQLRLKTP